MPFQISIHALNSAFALTEVILPRTAAPPPLHLVFIVLILALYLSLAYLTHRTQGFYPYTFLDIQTEGSAKTAGYIIGILVAACVDFGIVSFVIWVRGRLTEGGKRAGWGGKERSYVSRDAEDMAVVTK